MIATGVAASFKVCFIETLTQQKFPAAAPLEEERRGGGREGEGKEKRKRVVAGREDR